MRLCPKKCDAGGTSRKSTVVLRGHLQPFLWQGPAGTANFHPLSLDSESNPIMKFFSIFVGIAIALQTLALSAAQRGDPSETYLNLDLIPWPKSLELHDGKMRLGPHLRVVAADPQLRPLAGIVAGELDRASQELKARSRFRRESARRHRIGNRPNLESRRADPCHPRSTPGRHHRRRLHVRRSRSRFGHRL